MPNSTIAEEDKVVIAYTSSLGRSYALATMVATKFTRELREYWTCIPNPEPTAFEADKAETWLITNKFDPRAIAPDDII